MSMTDNEIMEIMPKRSATQLEAGTANTIVAPTNRKLLIVGCGDGGCNIAHDIAAKIGNDAYFVAYNTSLHGAGKLDAQKLIAPSKEDGAGKIRQFSKEVFKKNSYKVLLETIETAVADAGDFAYIVVCTTTDGGTGSGISPMTAKLIADNIDVPVIVLGVYPHIQEDPTAQFNALQWQAEINKVGVPYFVLDNNQGRVNDSVKIHAAINNYAALLMSLLAGHEYGNSSISMIDNRNLFMLLAHVGAGGRIVGAVSTDRLTSGQSLDEYVDTMLHANYQPLPSDCKGMGVFVKGPSELISKVDIGLADLQAKYGTATIKFAHIEESEETEISILMTGCSEAAGRLVEIRNRYDDVMAAQKVKESVVADLTGDIENPMGALTARKVSDTFNEDALNL